MAEDFFGFETKRFEFDGKDAVVVFADKANRTDKWLLKTEYFGAFPDTELEMLKRGYNLAHVNNQTRWCLASDTKRQADFCRFLHNEYGFAEKCAVVGMSCGGMQAVYLAAAFPEVVAVMYLDAPVINLLSCPGDLGKAKGGMFEEFKAAMGMDMPELIGYRNHPLDKIKDLSSDIPIILVSGDSDTIVPFDENGTYLYDYAVANKMTIELYLKKGGDHHPHGLADNTAIVDFIQRFY